MTNMTKIAGGALAALLVSTTLALAGSGGIGIGTNTTVQQVDKSVLQLAKKATCQVAGQPSEFPDDIGFTNAGAGILKKGTKLQWSIPSRGDKGTYTLVADLAPGAYVQASNINSGIEAGLDCKAKVL